MAIDLSPDLPVPPETRSAVWLGRVGWAVLLVVLWKVLWVAAGMIWFAVPVADEMEQAAAVRDVGAWSLIVGSYQAWTGAVGIGIFFTLEAIPNFRGYYGWLLAATQVTVPLALYSLLSATFGDHLRRRTRILLALGLVAVHWDGEINLWDSYYWLTGAVENRLSLSLGMWTLAGLIRSSRARRPNVLAIVGLAVLAAVTAGMHQLYGVYLVGILLVGTGLVVRSGSAGRGAWVVASLAAVAGLAANLLAPGNATRMAYEKAPHHLWWLRAQFEWWWKALFLRWMTDLRLWLATLVIVCHPRAAAAAPAWLRDRRGLVGGVALLAIIGLYVTVVLANWWSLSQPFPWRTQAAVYLLFMLAWFTAAFALAPLVAAPTPRAVWGVLAVCLGIALSNGRNYVLCREDLGTGRAATFRAAVAERDRLLREARAAGDLNPRVPPIDTVPYVFVFPEVINNLVPDTEQYRARNGAYCAYYGLHSIGLIRDDRQSSPH